jgi:hypothetical protein
MQLKELGQMVNSVTSLQTEHMPFQLVAQNPLTVSTANYNKLMDF